MIENVLFEVHSMINNEKSSHLIVQFEKIWKSDVKPEVQLWFEIPV